MIDFDGFFSSSGSMFDAREDLQYKLNDPRTPDYEKEELIRQHNWKYCDNMTTDTVSNQMRYNLSSPYYDHGSSTYKSGSTDISNRERYVEPLTLVELRSYMSPCVSEVKEYDVLDALVETADSIIVRKVSSASDKRGTNDAWILNRLNYMFCSLIAHKEVYPDCVTETERLVGKNAGLGEVFDKLRSNYSNKASYFYLPGAMLIVLEKFKSAQKTESYRNTEKLYLKYMDALISNTYKPDCYNEYLKNKTGKGYYSLAGYNERSYIPVTAEDVPFYRREERYAGKIKVTDRFTPYSEKNEIMVKGSVGSFISSWCDPLSFYDVRKAGISPETADYRTGPQSIGDRYGFFGYKQLENQANMHTLAYCAEMGCREDRGFFISNEKNAAVVRNVISRINKDNPYMELLGDFLGALRTDEQITRIYIEFCGRWIKDNLNYYDKNFFYIHREQRIDPDMKSLEQLEKIKSILIDKILDDLELRVAAFSGESLKEILDTVRNGIEDSYSLTHRKIEKYTIEFYSKRYWKPNKRCSHCGGEFRGVLKKVCAKCGKEKDY